MSQLASFYVISKADFAQYCKMDNIVSSKELPKRSWTVAVSNGTEEERSSPAGKEEEERTKKIWDFFYAHTKEPYQYDWSGYVLYEVLDWLKTTKNINLMELQYEHREEAFTWWVFDETVKRKYLEQLNPALFKKKEVIFSWNLILEQRLDADIKRLSATLSKKQLEQHVQMMRRINENFPNKDEAMMDGILILHKYLQLVDGELIVVLHIG